MIEHTNQYKKGGVRNPYQKDGDVSGDRILEKSDKIIGIIGGMDAIKLA